MWTSRTQLLLGEKNSSILEKKHVMIVGVGGVGAYAAEMICRAGIGNITIIDADTIKESNINRQLPALHSTIGKKKVTVLTERLLDINPNLVLKQHDVFIEKELIPSLFENLHVDFVIDAIDTLSPKIDLIRYCIQHKIKIVSSMGAGGRTDPSKIHYADISGTYHCTLAKHVRKRLKLVNISKGLPVVFSSEQVNQNSVIQIDDEKNKCSTVGTISYLPAIFGCYLAAYVIKKMIQK